MKPYIGKKYMNFVNRRTVVRAKLIRLVFLFFFTSTIVLNNLVFSENELKEKSFRDNDFSNDIEYLDELKTQKFLLLSVGFESE